MGKKEKFISELLKYSDGKSIESAKEEWNIIKVKKEAGRCICGQQLEYTLTLRSKLNKNIITVGSDCINKFIDNNLGIDMLRCYNKLLKNKYSLLSTKILQYLIEQEVIDEDENKEYQTKNWKVILAVNAKYMLSLIDDE